MKKNKMKGMIKRIKNKAGFTFVELIIAVAILGVVTAPILSAFVMTSRLNLKGRRKEQAMTVAQNMVEGVKAFGIAELLLQCDASFTSDFRIVPENSGTTKIGHKIKKNESQNYNVDITDYELLNGTKITNDDGSDVIVSFTAKNYEFEVTNILMGSTYYDAVITVTPNLDTEYIISYYYKDVFSQAGMSNLKYYDVRVDVSVHGDTEILATYNGTFLDQK